MTIRKMRPFNEPRVVRQIAKIYQQAFGGDPWYEGYSCPQCQEIFPLATQTRTCPNCKRKGQSIAIVDCWPEGKVVSDFYHEMNMPEAICLVTEEMTEVAGFAWGYKLSAGPTTSKKLSAPGLEALTPKNFFYLDEVAVLPAKQYHGQGKELVRRITQGKETTILRTLGDSPMQRLVEHMGGKILLPLSRGRVIMSLSL